MLSNYPDILTSEDICTLLKISKNTLYKLIHSGQLKAIFDNLLTILEGYAIIVKAACPSKERRLK